MWWWRPGHFLCCSLAPGQAPAQHSAEHPIQLVGSVCLFIQIGIIIRALVVQIHNNNRTYRVPESQFYGNPEMRRRSVNDNKWEDALWRGTIDHTPEGGNPGGWHIIGGAQCTGGMQTGQSDRATGNLMPPLDVAFPGAPPRPARSWQCCSQGRPRAAARSLFQAADREMGWEPGRLGAKVTSLLGKYWGSQFGTSEAVEPGE